MKINIEVQHLCSKVMGGIPYYTINLIEALISRNINQYSVSFFDGNKELNNRAYIEQYLKDAIANNLSVLECNDLSYKTIVEETIKGIKASYADKTYSEYFKTDFDICHLPVSLGIAENITQKTIVTVHDILPVLPEFKNAWNERTQILLEKSIEYIKRKKDINVIADSISTKNDLMSHFNISAERIYVVPLGYKATQYYPDNNKSIIASLGVTGPYLLYLGRLDSRKGIVDILNAFEIVKERRKDLILVLAGAFDTSAITIKERLNNYKYIEDVILPGFVTQEQKRALMSGATTFLFPSEYEGFGLPVLEAMACGTPVITTNVSSLPEVGGDAALYVTPKQPEELADAIERMLNSNSLRKEYVEKGFKQCKKFSWDKTAELTEEVYKIAFNQ